MITKDKVNININSKYKGSEETELFVWIYNVQMVSLKKIMNGVLKLWQYWPNGNKLIH